METIEIGDKKQQVIAQCRVVAHLATALASIHTDYATVFESSDGDKILDIVGERTAAFMEALGDMLNAMDAADEDDEWTEPIFAEAQRRWPVTHGDQSHV